MTFTKYLISASPGKPVKVGGKGFLTCMFVSLANSIRGPVTLSFVIMELTEVQALLKGIYRRDKSGSVDPKRQCISTLN